MRIRAATRDDNQQLLSLTSKNAMDGNISLRIDRNPDFFSLLQKRGRGITLVAEHEQEIIGCFSASECDVHINREPVSVHYLSDMKVAKTFQGGVAAFKLCEEMKKWLVSKKANLLLCTVAKGNDKLRPLVEGRMGLPEFRSLGIFCVFQFLPLRKPSHRSSADIQEVSLSEELRNSFNEFYSNYQLGKIIRLDSHDRFLVAKKQGKVIAAVSLFDSSHLKQNVVVGVNLLLRLILNIARVLPIPSLPSVGEAVRTLYINNFYCVPGHRDALVALVNEARHLAYQQHYHFVSLGLHTEDPLINCLLRLPKITFHSEALMATLQNQEDLINTIVSGVPYEDYSLV